MISEKLEGKRILTGTCRYYLDAESFCQFPNEGYPKERSQYRIAFLDMSKLSPEQIDRAFLELAEQHLEEGKNIEAKAEGYFQKWGGFQPAEPETYISQREVFIAQAANAIIGLTPVIFKNPGSPPEEIQPRERVQSLEDSQRDLVATYSYSLRRYHDVVGCYMAIAPESRPLVVREKLGVVVSAADRISLKVPKDIASVCEPYVPAAHKLSEWIKTKANIVLTEMGGK